MKTRNRCANKSHANASDNLLRAVVRKIGYQFPATPAGQLMHAVVGVAIADLFRPEVNESAERYLRGSIWHAQISGVDPDWIRSVLMQAGLLSRRAKYESN